MNKSVVKVDKPQNYLLVEGKQDCRFRPTYRIKAKIHTWLAWQKEPGKPLGQAITATYFNANAPHAQELIDWIRRLFVPEPV